MPAVLTVRDQTLGGATTSRVELSFPTERVTVRELIRSRVYQEVQDYNLKRAGVFHGLVQPTQSEMQLNGYALKPGRELDWKQQFERACEAYVKKHVLVLVGDRQTTALDDMIEIDAGTEVTFLRLLPLVGG